MKDFSSDDLVILAELPGDRIRIYDPINDKTAVRKIVYSGSPKIRAILYGRHYCFVSNMRTVKKGRINY